MSYQLNLNVWFFSDSKRSGLLRVLKIYAKKKQCLHNNWVFLYAFYVEEDSREGKKRKWKMK